MFLEPEKLVSKFGLRPGMIVADLGAGAGSMTFPIAKAVRGDTNEAGMGGRVYAIEVQKEILLRLKKEAEERHLTNIDIIWANIEKHEGTKIADHCVDMAVVSNVLFQVEDKMTFLGEVKRILKPDGRVVIIDWSESFGGMGPISVHVVTKTSAEQLMHKVGFEKERELEAGSHHYGVIFKKT